MKSTLILAAFILALNNIYSQEQESIYLPFPDLPQEILNPQAIDKDIVNKETTGSEFIKQDSYNKNSILPDLKSPNENLPNTEIKNSKKEDKNNQGNKNNSNKAKIKQQAIVSLDKTSLTKEDSSSKNTIPKTDSIMDPKNKNTSEENILTPEDREKFQKSMEEIRRSEKNDPENSIEKYKKLITQYSQPELRSKVLISIAWNYFHNQKNLECLDTILMILENKDFIHFTEYPTAMYLAARVHDRPWAGQNKNFTSRYHEIFKKNIDAGRENFLKSHYRNLIEKN